VTPSLYPPPKPIRYGIFDPVVFGTLCGLLSAAVYTGANACLRAVNQLDPVWVSAVKAVPTVGLMLPWMLIHYRRGLPILPHGRVLLAIAAAGLCGQLLGNISFQWALGQIGMALTVPLTLGGMIVCASILGRVFLGEPVSTRMTVAVGTLLVAMAVLSLGADDARRSLSPVASNPWALLAGVAAAGGSGLAYSVLNVVIRWSVSRHASLPVTLFTVSIMGLTSLGALSFVRIGVDGMLATSPREWWIMLGAGICNAIAFVALTKSLQLTSVVYVNALNATQATMAAVAGVLIFQEAMSEALIAGVGLTIVGLLLMRKGGAGVAVKPE
jgi:DME family drug/metabolite transporter